jgi:stringent starvation protein B
MLVAPELPTAKPFLLRAMYEWCCEQGQTPYVSVFVDHLVQVPMQFVNNGEITLNIGLEAANSLVISNETLEFKARFSGIVRHVIVPITHIMAIYGRENGQGMAFPITDPSQLQPPEVAAVVQMPTPAKLAAKPTPAAATSKEKTKPVLTRIK